MHVDTYGPIWFKVLKPGLRPRLGQSRVESDPSRLVPDGLIFFVPFSEGEEVEEEGSIWERDLGFRSHKNQNPKK